MRLRTGRQVSKAVPPDVTLLLDPHTLIWWMEGAHQRLSRKVRTLLSNSQTRVLISAAVAWELAVKGNVGKIKLSASLQDLGRSRARTPNSTAML